MSDNFGVEFFVILSYHYYRRAGEAIVRRADVHTRQYHRAAECGGHGGAFGYSKWYFCKKFREFSGVTFGEYVRHYRVQLAAIDILHGKKITDVAIGYGYDTPGGFNKAFLKEYGCLPREYKRQAKDSQLYYERRKNSMYKLTDRYKEVRLHRQKIHS